MKTAKEHLKSAALLGFTLLLVLFVAGGCKKKSEPAPTPEAPKAEGVTEAAEKAEETVAQAAAQVEQTTCPVMDGNPIDKNVFVEYKGKKVYFCCPECKAKFEADPEKYIADLPQFQQ